MDGRVLSFYYSFGACDGVLVLEAPDETAAAAIAPGHLRATKTTSSFAMEQTVEAMGQASGQSYAAPQG